MLGILLEDSNNDCYVQAPSLRVVRSGLCEKLEEYKATENETGIHMADSIIKKWYLEHHDTAENKHKFYEVQVVERGVKDFYVTRRFGRIGTNTKPKEVESFTYSESAMVKAEELVSAKRFSNRDRYTLVSQQEVNLPSDQQAAKLPKVAKPKQTFKIEKEPEPDNNYWSSLRLA